MGKQSGNKKRTRDQFDDKEDNVPQSAEKLLEKKSSMMDVNSDEDFEGEEEDGLDGDDEYVERNSGNDEDVQVDFDVNLPDFQRDYFGVELFAKNYLNGKTFDFVKFTELILGDEEKNEPNPLTSVIKVPYDETTEDGDNAKQQQQQSKQGKSMSDDGDDDDEAQQQNAMMSDDNDMEGWDWNMDTYGFITCLDYRQCKKFECMTQITNYVIENAPSDKVKEELIQIFQDGRIGLLLNERVLNMPLEMGVMLFDNLQKEVFEYNKKNGILFKYYLILTRLYSQKVASSANESSKKMKTETFFQKPEEEILFNRASIKFTFPIKFDYSYDSAAVGMEYSMERRGAVMLVEAKNDKMQKIIKEMNQQLQSSQQQPFNQ